MYIFSTKGLYCCSDCDWEMPEKQTRFELSARDKYARTTRTDGHESCTNLYWYSRLKLKSEVPPEFERRKVSHMSTKNAQEPPAKSKKEALQMCRAEHQVLMSCLENSGNACFSESKAFWDCYREKRGELRLDFTRLFHFNSHE